MLTARIRGAIAPLIVVALASCGNGDHVSAPVTDIPRAVDDGVTPFDSVRALALDTYDGSGQTVHPDFLSVPAWSGARGNLLALTPYPAGMSAFENPVVYQSTNLVQWSVPVPSLNPVASTASGYLSDPDLVYDPERDEVMMYYRRVDAENEVLLVRTKDVLTWTAPERVAHAPNHELISPSVVRRSATEWLMWSVNGHGGCGGGDAALELRRSADGVTWSGPEPVSLSQPGYSPRHVEVQWIPERSEYWALYNGKTAESCNTPALFFSTSKDGVNWVTYPSPLLARGETPAFRDVVYRSTFSYDGQSGVVTFWYSGATYDGQRFVWATAMERKRLARVFEVVTAEGGGGRMAVRRLVPEIGER